MRVIAVVPTYNRSADVTRSVGALVEGERAPDAVVVVDNASTDDTLTRLHADWGTHPAVKVVALPTNLGAAGGFAHGLRWALREHADAVWLVDDDALVDRRALAILLDTLSDEGDRCVASVMVGHDHETLCWGALTRTAGGWHRSWTVSALGRAEAVALYAPYTGLLLPRAAITGVGLPRVDFFMWADDVEYSLRLRDAGWPITLVPTSQIVHPVQARAHWRVLGRHVSVLEAPAWKRYYAVRNEVRMNLERREVARLVRQLAAALVAASRERDPGRAWPLYARGVVDGLLGRMGARVRPRR